MKFRRFFVAAILLSVSVLLLFNGAAADEETLPHAIIGILVDSHGEPVEHGVVTLHAVGEETVLSEASSKVNGAFLLAVPERLDNALELNIERSHYEVARIKLSEIQLEELRAGHSLYLQNIVLERKVGVAFWITALVFILMLTLVASDLMHNTLAALLGAVLMLGISYLGAPLFEGLRIIDFATAVEHVDWNVIFLVMGMMIVIAVVERTGVFQWLAFMAYRASGGRTWLLLPILMVVTGIASALLDNVTTMLLMTPISVQIALALGINPLTLLIPEVMASNVVGISTLIGTPTNILIGSYAGISFNGFLTNLTPGVLLAMVGLVLYSEYTYRHDLRPGGSISESLYKKLQEGARITEPVQLQKAGVVFVIMLVLFLTGENLHLPSSVIALMGATALLIWSRPDIDKMISAVDWTTLVFFIALFMVVGALQEVGIISLIAEWIGNLVGENLLLAMMAITWFSAILSMIVDNIPFAAAMLPVVGYLSARIPGAENDVLFFCLAVGAAMGGNGSLIGASANMVTAGISERAGFPITYTYFLKKGFPALLITVTLGSIWLVLRFIVF
ncbi:MAG: ArsB/NhaD family transporter [Anaerolineales bacterium]|nr:ArsB/NhaD family transporter [Anaerolineales bacterium]